MPALKYFKPAFDLFVTFFLWFYFIAGFVILYLPILFILSFFIKNRQTKFQKTNYYYYRIFFWELETFSPGLRIKIDKDVKEIKSSIVVSNHRSYFDPILLISIFPKHKTIVKGIFFKVPVLSWVMKSGGFIPYVQSNTYNDFMITSVKDIAVFTETGGNLFIFPEGKRSRDGGLRKFQKGAFSIAKKNNIPVQVIYINNTDKVFAPGKFLLNTCVENTISVEKLGVIHPSDDSVIEMKAKAVMMYEKRIKKDLG